MDYRSLIDSLTPDLVDRLRKGVETGRWPDGKRLTPEQREHSLQAVIAWERENLPEEQRVGFVDLGAKGNKGRRGESADPLRWVDTGPAGDRQ